MLYKKIHFIFQHFFGIIIPISAIIMIPCYYALFTEYHPSTLTQFKLSFGSTLFYLITDLIFFRHLLKIDFMIHHVAASILIMYCFYFGTDVPGIYINAISSTEISSFFLSVRTFLTYRQAIIINDILFFITFLLSRILFLPVVSLRTGLFIITAPLHVINFWWLYKIISKLKNGIKKD